MKAKKYPNLSKEQIRGILLEGETKNNLFVANGVKQFATFIYGLDTIKLKILIKKLKQISKAPQKSI